MGYQDGGFEIFSMKYGITVRANSEATQCAKQDVVLTKVYNIFTDQHHDSKRRQPTRQHVHHEQGREICISKEQIQVCGNKARPAEIISKEITFFCVAKDKQGHTLQRMAQRGEKIERAHTYPTAYAATVYEPRNC